MVACLVVLPASFAAGIQHASDAENPKLTTLKCKEFIAYNASYQPQVIYWAAAYAKGGSPENAVLDIEETEQLVPVVIAECKKTPKASFWQVVKAKFKEVHS